MKNLFILLILLPIHSLLAIEAVVTVLEAPLKHKPRLNAKTIQFARKGQKIYLHPKHFHEGQLSKLIVDPKEDFDDQVDSSFFSYYETLDNNGNRAYILKNHVKVIFQDEREYTQHINSYHHDPTDYRLEEPLPDRYPFSTPETYRAGLALTLGPNLKTNYNYNTSINNVEASSRKGFQFFYGRKANWDKESRFYFGGAFHFWSSQAFYTLSDTSITEEQQIQAGLGPLLSYDLWRNPKYAVTSSLSLTLNFTWHQVNQSSDQVDERLFTGLGFMPRFSNAFAVRNIMKDIDLTLGIDLQAFMPHELTAASIEANDARWTGDTIEMPFNAYWNVYLGFQGRY